ncbi:MAG: hypothetical protein RL513_1947, partial [Pseudomonadota bacterium]
AGELTALRERVQRYVDAQGWAVYDYDENGKPINRRVNPNIPDAYRKIMAAEAAAGLPGASEMLEFDAGMRPPAPSVGQGEAPATPAADADATGIDDDESGELPSLVREVGGEPLPLTEVGMGAAALNAGRDMPTTRGRITDAEIAAWFQRRATRQAARREADALRALR